MVTGAAKLNGVLGIEATELVPVDALGTCIRLTPQEFLDTPNLLPRETSRTGRLNTALLGFRLGGYSYGSASWSSQELSQQQQGKKIAQTDQHQTNLAFDVTTGPTCSGSKCAVARNCDCEVISFRCSSQRRSRGCSVDLM